MGVVMNLIQIEKNYQYIQERIKGYKTTIAQLTAAGTTQAKFYIRKDTSAKTGDIQETYYLLHPMRHGKRVKEYVGRDPYEIKKAKERQERYEVRASAIASLNKLENLAYELECLIGVVLKKSNIDKLF